MYSPYYVIIISKESTNNIQSSNNCFEKLEPVQAFLAPYLKEAEGFDLDSIAGGEPISTLFTDFMVMTLGMRNGGCEQMRQHLQGEIPSEMKAALVFVIKFIESVNAKVS